MACSSPLYAIDFGVNASTGKHIIKLLPKRPEYNLAYLKDRYGDILSLPCGCCDNCRLESRKSWAVRCYLESKYHKDNCFLTLTYDDDHLPCKVTKKDFQSFIKSLRNNGIKVRYFGCGEFGSTGRFHLHIILYGYKPDDLMPYAKSHSGFQLYKSNFIDHLWSKGFVTIQDFDISCAAYVAGYVNKKIDDLGRGFILMSKKPGIGEQYFLDNADTILERFNLLSNNGQVHKLPRYYKKLADKIGFDYSDKQAERILMAEQITQSMMINHDFAHIEQLYNLVKVHFQRRKL